MTCICSHRQPCPQPHACGLFVQRNGGASVDTDTPADAQAKFDAIEIDAIRWTVGPLIAVAGFWAWFFVGQRLIAAIGAWL